MSTQKLIFCTPKGELLQSNCTASPKSPLFFARKIRGLSSDTRLSFETPEGDNHLYINKIFDFQHQAEKTTNTFLFKPHSFILKNDVIKNKMVRFSDNK